MALHYTMTRIATLLMMILLLIIHPDHHLLISDNPLHLTIHPDLLHLTIHPNRHVLSHVDAQLKEFVEQDILWQGGAESLIRSQLKDIPWGQ